MTHQGEDFRTEITTLQDVKAGFLEVCSNCAIDQDYANQGGGFHGFQPFHSLENRQAKKQGIWTHQSTGVAVSLEFQSAKGCPRYDEGSLSPSATDRTME